MARHVRPWIEKLYRVFGDGGPPSGGKVRGAYAPDRNAIRMIHAGDSQFGEMVTASRTPIIELNSTFGLSVPLRDRVVETNGAVTAGEDTGELSISTGTDPDSEGRISSSEVGRYIPGYGAQLGVGMRFPDAPTGTQNVQFGGFQTDFDNGLFFGYDAGGIYVARRRSGVETDKVYQEDWNIDKADGTGPSAFTLDLSSGNIYQIEWTWYGYGQIVYGILGVVDNKQTFIPVHELSGFDGTSLIDPSMRIKVRALNGGTTMTDLKVYIGGRQYSIIGAYVPKYRFTGERRGSTSLSTAMQPLVSFRIKDGFKNRSVKLQGYELINTGNAPIYAEIRLDGTLTGASWQTPTNYTAADTALESDISATAITGGNVIWAGDIANAGNAGLSGASGLRDIDLDLPEEGVVTLCAASFTGTPAVYSGFRLREEW